MKKKSEEKSKVESTTQKNKSVTIFPSGKQILHRTIQLVRNSITLINLTKRGNKEPGKKNIFENKSTFSVFLPI